MEQIYQITIGLVVIAGLSCLPFKGPLRRCGAVLLAAQLVLAVFEVQSWPVKMAVDILAMVIVMYRPAGALQIVIGGMFLAAAGKHLAFGLSNQSYTAAATAWQIGITITIAQALILLSLGGRHIGKAAWRDLADMRRGLVRNAHSANRP